MTLEHETLNCLHNANRMSHIKVILAYVPVLLEVNLSGLSTTKFRHVFCVCVNSHAIFPGIYGNSDAAPRVGPSKIVAITPAQQCSFGGVASAVLCGKVDWAVTLGICHESGDVSLIDCCV
jgi:hypothetical protein